MQEIDDKPFMIVMEHKENLMQDTWCLLYMLLFFYFSASDPKVVL